MELDDPRRAAADGVAADGRDEEGLHEPPPRPLADGAPDFHALRVKVMLALADSPAYMPWDVRHEQALYLSKLAHVSARCRLSLTEERRACVQDLFTALTTLYADREPHLVQELAEATAKLFERDRFATKREIEELKKLAADASALFPAEFRSAEPSAVRMLFKRREAEKSAALVAAS